MQSEVKNKICGRFNRAALTYDSHCATQRVICQRSIDVLLRYKNNFKNIADFACGTGESINCLINNLEFENCYGVDFADQLLGVAKCKFSGNPKINLIQGDFDQKLQIDTLDLIFCNMGLQWSDDISRTLNLWEHYLEINACLLLSMPIDGNFPEIKDDSKPAFLCHQDIINILSEKHYQLIVSDVEFFEETFDSQIEALKSLKSRGVNYNRLHHQQEAGLSRLKLDRIFTDSDSKKLTYCIGIYLARKIR